LALLLASSTRAQELRIAKADPQIDGLDPEIRLFLREKMPEGTARNFQALGRQSEPNLSRNASEHLM
jgi:hypothetical protein